jgi:CRP/FNR family transcriptional regulator, cyclic AMP receptor protein
MDQRQRVTALRRVPILAVLPENKLEILARDCKWRTYEASQQILSYHDPSLKSSFSHRENCGVIVYSAEGKAVVFTDLRPGAMFGEIAAIDRGPRSAGVEAIETSTIASLTASQFESLLLREPAVSLASIRHVTAEVPRLSERVVEFSALVVQNRIHAELLRLAADAGFAAGRAYSPQPRLSPISSIESARIAKRCLAS